MTDTQQRAAAKAFAKNWKDRGHEKGDSTDGSMLTPFEQAKRYSSELPYSKRPRWIVTSNFQSFYIYDMEKPGGDPEIIQLEDLEKEYYRLQFFVDEGNTNLQRKMEVSIDQFYGIEINDFAVTVAKTALWIAESQMMKETEDIVHMNLDFLPLTTNAFIVEGNSLQIDWESFVSK